MSTKERTHFVEKIRTVEGMDDFEQMFDRQVQTSNNLILNSGASISALFIMVCQEGCVLLLGR